MTIDPIFAYANYAEACLWTGLAFVAVARRNSRWSFGLAIALLAFGVSDVVEVRTGAWYRPWWMLAWKATCVLLIVFFGAGVARGRRLGKPPHKQYHLIESRSRVSTSSL